MPLEILDAAMPGLLTIPRELQINIAEYVSHVCDPWGIGLTFAVDDEPRQEELMPGVQGDGGRGHAAALHEHGGARRSPE